MRDRRASRTALGVARLFVALGYDPRHAPFLPNDAASATERLLVALRLLPRSEIAAAQNPTMQRLRDWGWNRLVSHPLLLGLRKRFIDDEVRAALAAGARQVLMVGAGYDTLLLRLAPEYPDRIFVEIDHPATHASKREGLAAIGADRPNHFLLAADLTRVPLKEALAAFPHWDPTGATVVVIEGLLFFLQPAAADALFAGVHAITGPGSRVIFDVWMRGPDGRNLGRLMSATLAAWGEPWLWRIQDEAALAAFLARNGFSYQPDPARFDPRLRYLDPARIDYRGWTPSLTTFAVAERS